MGQGPGVHVSPTFKRGEQNYVSLNFNYQQKIEATEILAWKQNICSKTQDLRLQMCALISSCSPFFTCQVLKD